MTFKDIELTVFGKTVPDPALNICVIVPVKNEASHLEATLKSLCNQLDIHGNKIDYQTYEVLLLINNSTDKSFQIASDFKMFNGDFRLLIEEIELPGALANIGTVRRLLMNEANLRFNGLNRDRGIIASIDGDTIADKCWLYHIQKEIAAGNDAVGGLITIKGKAGSADRAYSKDKQYRNLLTEVEHLLFPQINDPLPRHFHFFGANMAVTSEYYHKSGGIPDVNCLEDMAFHKALLRCDARIRRSPQVKVVTSARFEGRVAVGFSEQLKKWSQETEDSIPQIVENSELSIFSCYIKSLLHAVWKAKDHDDSCAMVEDLAITLGVAGDWLKEQLYLNEFFGAFWESAWNESSIRKTYQSTFEPIQNAIDKLRKFTRNPVINFFETDPNDIVRHGNLSSA